MPMSEVRDNMFAYIQSLVDFLSVDTGLSKQEVLEIVQPAMGDMRTRIERAIQLKKSKAAITAEMLESLTVKREDVQL